ncbi:MAG: L,D-transpeptidase/peptidoglycan binding protein [Clostridiales bacterium]|nr:L,D-transpeptidase/peptidoglycan binding protein [Clostridiales bacterium]
MNTEEKTKSNTKLYIVLIIAIVLVILAFGYLMGARYYATHFPRNTTVNGIDVSNTTADNVKLALNNNVQSYVLTIQERDGVTETVTAADVGMTYQDNGEVDELLAGYNPYAWLFDCLSTDEHTISASIQIDEDTARASLALLDCFNDALITEPEDACLVIDGGDYYIQSEVYGNRLDEDKAVEVLLEALAAGETTVDLDAEGCYIDPDITSEDAELQSQFAQLDVLLGAEITFDFEDDRIEVVNAEVIADWLVLDEDGTYSLDGDLVYDWVKTQLAYQYDTFGLTHTFTTSAGNTITLTGGDYGWCIARQDTTDKLIAAIENGEVTDMDPEYQYEAKYRGINDIGDTYVEISISQQTVWCYKDGELVVKTACVTGNPNKGNGTPSGSVWAIDAKKSPATLGTLDTMGYESPVTYWMPFTGNVGLHDADGWRSSYGGTIYQTNGSHGCVNLPLSAAELIYNAVEIGTAVIVYD